MIIRRGDTGKRRRGDGKHDDAEIAEDFHL